LNSPDLHGDIAFKNSGYKNIQSIIEPFEKLSKRQKTISKDLDQTIDSMIAAPSTPTQTTPDHLLKKQGSKLQDSAKELASLVGKCSKAVEKKLKGDFDSTGILMRSAGKEHVLNRILMRAFTIREGPARCWSEAFSKECNVPLDENLSLQFILEMFHISQSVACMAADLY